MSPQSDAVHFSTVEEGLNGKKSSYAEFPGYVCVKCMQGRAPATLTLSNYSWANCVSDWEEHAFPECNSRLIRFDRNASSAHRRRRPVCLLHLCLRARTPTCVSRTCRQVASSKYHATNIHNHTRICSSVYCCCKNSVFVKRIDKQKKCSNTPESLWDSACLHVKVLSHK